jgi:hypothetical protein
MVYVNYDVPFDPKDAETNLIYALIMQAVEDKDIDWLQTKTCKYYCELIEVDHSRILSLLNTKKLKRIRRKK